VRDGEVERRMENVGRLERRMEVGLQLTRTTLLKNRGKSHLFVFVKNLLKINPN
jgi:hypothetical protein